MSGVFADWQPVYAGHGIATFPVVIVGKDKRPAVKGYLKLGSKVSGQLAIKFPEHEAIGLACRRNKITVLDVDTPDERVLADGLAKHGHTPFIVRSGSGHFQAWYRRNGEGRRIRPDPDVPIDILGDGYVVAPPSRGARGDYKIVSGKLDDLDCLPVMRRAAPEPGQTPWSTNDNAPNPDPTKTKSQSREGLRNDTLWRRCMMMARQCSTSEELTAAAMQFNKQEFNPMLPIDEVLKTVESAWRYETQGKNFFGQGPRLMLDFGMVDELAVKDQRAYALGSVLLRHHAGSATFFLANAMADTFGWSVNTFKAARDVLVEFGLIECVHPGGKGPNDPPVYRFTKGVRE
ncbi:bifunctional DNA primase/polymerase [Mesorhizobium australafricanum]|uniref:Bifunctional DNA primase/polymerase n=1 Tax=Mesorhizobium australafricanum TaxID=3072311 RepID=A0ABU4WRF7_9HYPH|nr:bifunctional DNA primase/polymerase [Mesorhizobium sp. VK3E]MDX8438334.1 bifunctional DNA primase/polymerase [Mesorhizobium sp. VK3E]